MIKELIKRTEDIKNLHLKAFGEEEGPLVAKLAEDFLLRKDSISISIEEDGSIVGNVIFSPFRFEDCPERKYFLLAPLGVSPEYQGKGIGKRLIEKGVKHLKSLGGEAIFVLGEPAYYPLRGFKATPLLSPYSELMKAPEAWMVLEIKEGGVRGLKGRSIASPPIMKEMFWDTSCR